MERITRTFVVLAAAALLVGSACNKPAKIFIDSPAHGSFTTAAQTTLTGHVQPMRQGLQVDVNGTVVPLQPDGTWSVTMPLDASAVINPFVATLTQVSNGRQLSRKRIVVHRSASVADGAFSNNGVALRINDSGLDQIEPVIQSQINLDLATLLPVGTTVINNECFLDSVFGCIMRVTVRVASPAPSISGWAFNADSQTNLVFGDIDVFDIRVQAQISGGLSCGVRIQAASAQILGNYELRPMPGDPSNVDVNLIGSPSVSFSGFSHTFTSGACNWFLIGDIISAIVGDIQPMVRNGLIAFLDDDDGAGPLDSPLADAFEVALADISITGPVGEALGVMLEAPLFDVIENPTGITLGSHVRVTSSIGGGPGQCQPPADAPNLLASHHVAESFPSFGATTPGGLPYHLGIAISSSAFNQLLKAQIECGLLRIELSELSIEGGEPLPLTAGTLRLLIPELGVLPPATPMVIRLTPTLAPFLTGNPGPGGELGELRVGQYTIELLSVGPNGEHFLQLAGALDFRAGLDMDFDDATGSLVVGIGSVTPEDVTVSILYNGINTNETTLALSLPSLVAGLLPELGSNLGAFPIPSFLGLSLQGVEVSRSGAFYSLFTNLAPAP